MKHKAPGKHYRKGLSLPQLFKMFPDDATAEAWFVKARWPDGVCCPLCGSVNVQSGAKHKTMPYRCRDCRVRFSARTGTALEASNKGFQVWGIAIYLLATNLKSVSSMKLSRDLKITQRTAWHLAHRIREAWKSKGELFAGPVARSFIPTTATLPTGPRPASSFLSECLFRSLPPMKVSSTSTGKVSAEVVESTDQLALFGFIAERVQDSTAIYTDEHRSYQGLPNHTTVKHSAGEFVNGMAHTNGIESFWSLLKRGYHGTFHKMSVKHLDRYVTEFSGRHNMRECDTIQQMSMVARGLDGKRLPYKALVG